MFAEPPRSHNLKLVIVGEGPGRKEEIQGRPFVGPSGALLDQVLKEAGIRREDAYVTNACLCRAEDDKSLAASTAACAPRLLRELRLQDAPILALGKAAAKSVLGVTSIQLARGFVWTAPDVTKKMKAAKVAAKRAVKKGRESGPLLDRVEELQLRQQIAGRTVFPTVHPAFVLRSDAWRPIFALDVRRVGRWTKGEL